jgi:hypothetical protein
VVWITINGHFLRTGFETRFSGRAAAGDALHQHTVGVSGQFHGIRKIKRHAQVRDTQISMFHLPELMIVSLLLHDGAGDGITQPELLSVEDWMASVDTITSP